MNFQIVVDLDSVSDSHDLEKVKAKLQDIIYDFLTALDKAYPESDSGSSLQLVTS